MAEYCTCRNPHQLQQAFCLPLVTTHERVDEIYPFNIHPVGALTDTNRKVLHCTKIAGFEFSGKSGAIYKNYIIF